MTEQMTEEQRMQRSLQVDTIAEELFQQLLQHTKEVGPDKVNEHSNVLGDKIADALYDCDTRLVWYHAIAKVLVMMARVAQAEVGIPPMATLAMLVKLSGALMRAQDKDAMRELGEGVTKQ